MTAVQILREARRLLETRGWTTHTLARNSHGQFIDPAHDSAASFCAVGAIQRAIADTEDNGVASAAGHARCALDHVVRADGGNVDIVGFNDRDGTSREDILLTFKHAEQYADERGW